jgi:hypothetical protein
MQHIGITITDERNNVIENSDINFAPILELIQGKSDKELTFLLTIDPFGDTIFNNLQKKYVILGLNSVKEKSIDNEIIVIVDKTIKLAEKVSNHLYLKFTGD